MSNKQLMLLIGTTAALALVLAWVIERTQVRQFVLEFDKWWDEKQGGTSGDPSA